MASLAQSSAKSSVESMACTGQAGDALFHRVGPLKGPGGPPTPGFLLQFLRVTAQGWSLFFLSASVQVGLTSCEASPSCCTTRFLVLYLERNGNQPLSRADFKMHICV